MLADPAFWPGRAEQDSIGSAGLAEQGIGQHEISALPSVNHCCFTGGLTKASLFAQTYPRSSSRLSHATAPKTRVDTAAPACARLATPAWPRRDRAGPYRPRNSCQVLPLLTLVGCSAAMSDPGRAPESRTLTRIQRLSPVRVSAKPPDSLRPCRMNEICPGSSRTISAVPSSQISPRRCRGAGRHERPRTHPPTRRGLQLDRQTPDPRV